MLALLVLPAKEGEILREHGPVRVALEEPDLDPEVLAVLERWGCLEATPFPVP